MKTSSYCMVVLTTILAVQFAGHVCAGPPLPFHTLEGVGGGAITPMAYLVNPEPEGALFGKPSVALTYVSLGCKNLDAMSITETLGGRIELGYAANRLGLDSLPGRIEDCTAVDIGCSDVWLHHFNLRMLLVKENTCLAGVALPAITGGVHFKVNDGIQGIDQKLCGALSQIGLREDSGQDFTLTMTKTVPPELLGLPVIVTAGVRASEASQLGLLGFGDKYHATFEGSIAILPREWLVLAYEYRQKPDPYRQIAGLIGDEDDWKAFDVAVILGEHATFCAGCGWLGTVADAEEDAVWFLQMKYEL